MKNENKIYDKILNEPINKYEKTYLRLIGTALTKMDNMH